ncbi:MAG: hypothetical protein EVA76_01255 [Candidatus Pelagibacterales bacterium]|nr:MAG: hypothetical protein EVA76_01255 [Pelagibacterales bacterium]
MFLKKINNFITNDKFLLFIIFLVSFLINKNYANLGAFPIDTFLHFDSGFRILNGEYPIKDFWIVSGIAVDYLEALFFYLLGVSWKTHVIHSSLFNGIITLATYGVLRSFQFKKIYSFLYSLFFGILAYPPSGTPFVDHHAAFFALLGIYCFILALNNKKDFYWIFMPIFFGLSFFSKQVPGSYIILPIAIITIFYSIIKKEYNPIKYSLLGSVVFFIIVFFIGAAHGISLNAFFTQYIMHPQSIADKRLNNLNFSFGSFVTHYKFIFLALIPLIYLNISNIFNNKNYLKEKKFYIFLIILFYTVGLIFHQILTKNQIFIYFLCPLLFAFLKIYLNSFVKSKKIIFLIILALTFFITIKYHLRFNENRKFHELINVNLNLSEEAYLIDKRLEGLKWITPHHRNNPKNEIDFLNNTLKILKQDKRNKMVMTNYLFFSTIMNEKLNSPSKTYTLNGVSFPVKGNKYYLSYKKYLNKKVKDNEIKVIYIISLGSEVSNRYVYDYLDKNCIIEQIFTKQFKKYEINKC